jgi:hypothetical protein
MSVSQSVDSSPILDSFTFSWNKSAHYINVLWEDLVQAEELGILNSRLGIIYIHEMGKWGSLHGDTVFK